MAKKKNAQPTTKSNSRSSHHPDHLPRDPRAYSQVLREVPTSSSFVVLPKSTNSSILLDDEIIILILRQHWITLVPTILVVLILFLVPFFLFTQPFFDELTLAFRLVLWIFWFLGIGGIALQKAVTWFYNVYILTDERIIDVNFPSILTSDISTTKIDNIEDYSMKSNGFLPTLLNYGRVDIQTAAEEKEFSFQYIPYPEKVTKLLGELVAEEELEELEGRVK